MIYGIVNCFGICYTTLYGTNDETQKSEAQEKAWVFIYDENTRRTKHHQTQKSSRKSKTYCLILISCSPVNIVYQQP